MFFAEAQAAVVHEGEDRPEASFFDRAEESGDLLAAQDVGELLVAPYLDPAPALPLPAEVVAVEGAQGADGLVDGGVLELALLAQGNEEVEDLVLAELRGIAVREGLVELSHPAEVGSPGSWREATEIDTAFEVAPLLLRLKPARLAATGGTDGGPGGGCSFFHKRPKKESTPACLKRRIRPVGAAKRLRSTSRSTEPLTRREF